jgi:hypothetical protein
MASPDNLVLIYKELADAHERRNQPQMRDRYLVLAADAAQGAGRAAEADLLLARLLRANPHHMLRPFHTFAQAMASPDIRNYVGELRRTHPPQQAEAEFDALRAARPAAAPRPTRALPATSLDAAPDAEDEREPLKVYRVQDESDAPRPAPPRPAPRPVVPVPAPAPAPPPAADPEEAPRGSWLSVALSVLVLAAGLALAGWTLLRPFLPKM